MHRCFPKVLIKLLLERGADASAADARGTTAMHVAAKFGKLGAVEVFVDAGGSFRRQEVAAPRFSPSWHTGQPIMPPKGRNTLAWACGGGSPRPTAALPGRILPTGRLTRLAGTGAGWSRSIQPGTTRFGEARGAMPGSPSPRMTPHGCRNPEAV